MQVWTLTERSEWYQKDEDTSLFGSYAANLAWLPKESHYRGRWDDLDKWNAGLGAEWIMELPGGSWDEKGKTATLVSMSNNNMQEQTVINDVTLGWWAQIHNAAPVKYMRRSIGTALKDLRRLLIPRSTVLIGTCSQRNCGLGRSAVNNARNVMGEEQSFVSRVWMCGQDDIASTRRSSSRWKKLSKQESDSLWSCVKQSRCGITVKELPGGALFWTF